MYQRYNRLKIVLVCKIPWKRILAMTQSFELNLIRHVLEALTSCTLYIATWWTVTTQPFQESQGAGGSVIHETLMYTLIQPCPLARTGKSSMLESCFGGHVKLSFVFQCNIQLQCRTPIYLQINTLSSNELLVNTSFCLICTFCFQTLVFSKIF